MKLVIKNGHVMDPASGRDEVTDIWVEDKRIIGFGYKIIHNYLIKKRWIFFNCLLTAMSNLGGDIDVT